jgi:hypothetical protein
VTWNSENFLYIYCTNDHILLSHLRLPQPGGPGSRICIPQEQSGPVIPPEEMGARGSLVVKELCYKPEGRGFETRWDEHLSIYLIFPALGFTQPQTEISTRRRKIIYLASRERPLCEADNLYRHMRAECLYKVGSSTCHKPRGLHGLLQGWLHLPRSDNAHFFQFNISEPRSHSSFHIPDTLIASWNRQLKQVEGSMD